jgi:hypothetical protein
VVERGIAIGIAIVAATLPANGQPSTEAQWAAPARDLLVQAAENLLVADASHEVRSAHFRVITDVPGNNAATTLANDLEAVWGAMEREIWPDLTLLQPLGEERIRAYLFASSGQYQKLRTAVFGDDHANSAGFYITEAGFLAFHRETDYGQILRQVMIHEGVHAYVDHRVTAPQVALPRWLDEGLAEYVALSRIHEGQLRLGVYCKKTFYTNERSGGVTYSVADQMLAEVKKSLRKARDVAVLPSLMSVSELNFGDLDEVKGFYGRSWAFVNFLRHGKPEWKMDHFPRFVLAVAVGKPAAEALEEVYGTSAQALDTDFKQWTLDFDTVRFCR